MKTGFETIGNATIIAYDGGKSVLATDPWMQGSSYFGSWALSHQIPEAQMRAVKEAPFIWFSHGHPDHLNPDSLELFKGKTILIPDHVGARIHQDLGGMGYQTRILKNKEWVQLSEKVRILCIADYYQDAILLIDINGRLLVNTNDALDRGWGRFVRKIISSYKTSFLLSLFGYGDADMINYYREDGSFIAPKAALKLPIGAGIQQATESYGVSYYIPFSTMHQYQRTDSIWAQPYTTPIEDFALGFKSNSSQILPAFVHYDCETDEYVSLNPPENKIAIQDPSAFGDNWADPLSPEDFEKAKSYFQKIEHLSTFLDYINLRIGGRDNVIPLGKSNFARGLQFELPRGSLMTAIEYRIFDDLLIGNFMKTTLIGHWPKSGLYPDFTPYVARYADNGFSYSKEELETYFNQYRERDPLTFRLHQLEMKSIETFRSLVTGGSPLFQAAKAAYWMAKRLGR